jgi:Fur family ferric uptake transcriptional regulator
VPGVLLDCVFAPAGVAGQSKPTYTSLMPGDAAPCLPLGAESEIAAMAPLCAVFRRYLRSRNLKYTPERADVLDAIIERDDLFEVEELMLEMRRRGYRVSKATIYRTVKLLQEAGIITQALFDPRQAHYRLIYGKAPRDYMVCVRTGRHVEFSDPELIELRNRICARHGWQAVGHRFEIYGTSPQGALPP